MHKGKVNVGPVSRHKWSSKGVTVDRREKEKKS